MIRSIIFSMVLLKASCGYAPVILLPGYSGSRLFVTVNDSEYIPVSCEYMIPVGVSFAPFSNLTLMKNYPNCVADLMRMDFNKQSQFVPLTGIDVSVVDFGGYNGILPVYWPFAKQLEDWGYVTMKNSFGAPYDYRYSSAESFVSLGFFDKLKELIISAFTDNNDTRVMLICHSNGCPTLYAFLTSLPTIWKGEYVAGAISLSGNFLGQMNMIKGFVYSDNTISQEMFNSWEAQYTSCSWQGGYTPYNTDVIVTTHAGSDAEVKYTTSLADVTALLRGAGRDDWADKFSAVYDLMNRSAPMGVDSYCFYGSDVSTSYSYAFIGDILQDNEPYETIAYMDGDGNQDIIDNTFCEVWKTEKIAYADKEHVFESKAFPGVRHMQMCTDEKVMESIRQVLSRYETFDDQPLAG
jgi:hypothetical protein